MLVRCDYSEDDLEALKQIPKDSITLQKYGVLLFAVCIIECDYLGNWVVELLVKSGKALWKISWAQELVPIG